jgi:GMP synthase-like glutamine amidotransferase
MGGLYVKNGITGIQIIKLIKRSIITIKKIDEINEMTNDLFNNFMCDFSFVIIGGGKYDLNFEEFAENIHVAANVDVIKYCEANRIPLFGLGLGCQLIALTYGMSIEKAEYEHIGPNYLNMNDVNKSVVFDDKFMQNFNWEMIVKAFSYNTNIITNIENSDVGVLIKTHDDIPYVIKHKKFLIYGIQSHPDIDSMTGALFLNTLKIKTQNQMTKELILDNDTYLHMSEIFIEGLIDAFIKHENNVI